MKDGPGRVKQTLIVNTKILHHKFMGRSEKKVVVFPIQKRRHTAVINSHQKD